jgi:hypothetical protein
MKIVISLFTAGLIVAGVTVAGSTKAAGRRICRGPWQLWGMIAPGVRLGEFRLGSDGVERLEKLAKPDAVESGDLGTCRIWNWGENERFFVHTVEAGQTTTVDLVGFSYPESSTYRTSPSDISTGSTLEEIQKSFPDAMPVATAPTIYDDTKQGIAFEFENVPDANTPCIAIMVHFPGQSRTETWQQVAAILKKGAKR